MRPKDSTGVKASVFFALRTELLKSLADVDSEIDQTLGFKSSKRAAEMARQLFAERARLSDELLEFGVEVDAHPALGKK